MGLLESEAVVDLVQLVEESTRSSKEGVKYFLEPAPGVLNRAKSKRHHIIFGRRGSGKSSLLRKTESDLSIARIPVVVVDLEEFKGHSYPDVLISVLIKTLGEFKTWLGTTAVYPSEKKSFWSRFGGKPSRQALEAKEATEAVKLLEDALSELNKLLAAPDEADRTESQESLKAKNQKGTVSAKIGTGQLDFGGSAEQGSANSNTHKLQSTYRSRKIEALHRNIITYKAIIQKICELGGGASYLLLDDLYHIRLNDQPEVIDYFHRLAKGAGLWLKIGTIKHRSRWYVAGNPTIGMKIADDADGIDLDITLEKYDLTKKFLLKILDKFASEKSIILADLLTPSAQDRLVLASGGVARDFLTIFRRAIEVAQSRVSSGGGVEKVIVEDVNIAAGEHDSNKREEFTLDTRSDDRVELSDFLERIIDFCLKKTEENCLLIDKETRGKDQQAIGELVDLKFLHHVKSRVTVRGQSRKIYDAYMLDVSQYIGQRKRQGFEMIQFWGKDSADALRKNKLIFM